MRELEKGPKKYQPHSNVVNHSQSLLNMRVKVGIKPYQGEVGALKLNY